MVVVNRQKGSLAVGTYGKDLGLQWEGSRSITGHGIKRGLSIPSLPMLKRKKKKEWTKGDIFFWGALGNSKNNKATMNNY